MERTDLNIVLILLVSFVAWSCNAEKASSSEKITELPAAFEAFDKENTTIMLDGDEIIIESNGLPNHRSPYWSNTTKRVATDPRGRVLVTEGAEVNHPLFVNPTYTSFGQMAPGNIDDFNGGYTLIVPAVPKKAAAPSSTGLGPIGIAVSGSMIYNDNEGPNIPLDDAAPSLDFNGAHTGPQSYHYHLEPLAFSDDDDNLIGIISDGFFLFGRKCTATGTYPNDLDESGGHVSATKYNMKAVYHYHIQNELYLNRYYILFPGNYQGSPNAIH